MGWRKRALVLSVRQQYDSKIQNAAPVSPDAWGETGAAFHGRLLFSRAFGPFYNPSARRAAMSASRTSRLPLAPSILKSTEPLTALFSSL